jgi:signal transduction histidine kinase
MAIRDPALAEWLLDSLSSGFVAIDASGILTGFNPAAKRILGGLDGEPSSWLGSDFRAVLAGRPEVIGLLEDALDGRPRPSRAETVLPARGELPETTIGFTLMSICDPSQEVRGAAIQFRDLSAFEQLGERARLRDRLAALGEMAAGLAHELRNPLAGMELMAGLLKWRLDEGSEEHALVLDLLAQLRVVAGTLDETLDFVRPVVPACESVDPAALLDLATDRACARVEFPGKVERDYAVDAPAASGDSEQLLVAVTDLVVNALEAMDEAPTRWPPRLQLGVHSERRPGHRPAVRVDGRSLVAEADPLERREVVISIADSGPGVPEEVRDRIFYPFFTTKDAGSGVGLAKAQKIVASHGGSIELETREGEGALFRIRLPAAESES